MALPLFYETALLKEFTQVTVSEETSKHCIQVLRMKKGDRLQLTNGKGSLYTACITEEDKKNLVIQVEGCRLIPPPAKKINICISLLKNASRLEWFLEKATEIGVSSIQPLLCSRTENNRFRHERMNAILVAAMLQSQQSWLPVLQEPVPLNKYMLQSEYPQKLIAHCEDEKKQYLLQLGGSGGTEILIGPEGDFTRDEINLALNNHYLPVTLGQTRLRTETAGVVAAALLMAE